MNNIFKYSIIASISLFAFFSCKPKDSIICPESDCLLNFSNDTVVFDTTVFTGVKTITKRLTVYNFNKNAVNISEISIPENSPFKLIINGERQNSMHDIFLRGEDKLLILVEAIFNENENDSITIVEEDLKFITNNQEQKIVLAAPTQNVYFHDDEIVPCNTVWKNDKPHLIYRGVLVENGCKLTIEPGTNIYSHGRSGIYVLGSIEAIGTPEEPITFTDDRLDNPDTYNDIFGIWEGIILAQGSSNHTFDWININNAVNGIYVNTGNADGSIDVIIGHAFINTIGNNSSAPSFTRDELGLLSGFGLIGVDSKILVHNSLITNCTSGSVYTLLNGIYYFTNNTFTNYPTAPASFNRSKDIKTFYAATTTNDVNGGNMTLVLHNNIIYGENSSTEDEEKLDELVLVATDNFPFSTLDVSNNIIKTNEYEDLLNDGNLLNEDPFPSNITSREVDYDFTLEENSNAIDAGLAETIGINNINIDLKNEVRDITWDIGAYEYYPE